MTYILAVLVMLVQARAFALAEDNTPKLKMPATVAQAAKMPETTEKAALPVAEKTEQPALKTATPVTGANIADPNIDKAAPPKPAPLKSITNNGAPDIVSGKIKQNFPRPEFNRSLMFKQDEINKVRMVHKVYMDRVKNMHSALKNSNSSSGVEDILSRLTGAVNDAANLPPAPLGIYLDSILFRSIGNATAWINGKKYDIGSVTDNIKLVSVSSAAAEIEWRMGVYKDSDINDWLAVFPEITENEKKGKQPPSRANIKVSSADKTIHFSLKPNQYLDIQGKSIREGRPKPLAPAASEPGAIIPGAPLVEGGKEPLTDKIDMPEKTPPPEEGGEKKAVYKAAPDGHFNVAALINGQTINFRVDTGATYPVISRDDARRIGINVDKLQYNYEARTANGVNIPTAQTTVDMQMNDVKFTNINVMVADGVFPQALLGQSFINKYALVDHGTLTITNPVDANPPSPQPPAAKPADNSGLKSIVPTVK